MAPDVPVTVKVSGVVDVWALEEPPQPTAHKEINETTSSKPNTPAHLLALRVSGFRWRVVKTVPKRPSAGRRPAKTAIP